MKLRVNGEEHEHKGSGTILDVLAEIKADAGRVAVMVNDRIIPKAEFGKTMIREGDGIEVLTFMGGG